MDFFYGIIGAPLRDIVRIPTPKNELKPGMFFVRSEYDGEHVLHMMTHTGSMFVNIVTHKFSHGSLLFETLEQDVDVLPLDIQVGNRLPGADSICTQDVFVGELEKEAGRLYFTWRGECGIAMNHSEHLPQAPKPFEFEWTVQKFRRRFNSMLFVPIRF